jgi:hypothetical protein
MSQNTSTNFNNNFNNNYINLNNVNNINNINNSDLAFTPINALQKQINEINLINSIKLNENNENEGDKTNRSLISNRSNLVNIDEMNQTYNNLITKMQIIKTNHPDFYNECCENYKNLILDSEKIIFVVLKIISDYETFFLHESIKHKNALGNYDTKFNSISEINNINTNTNNMNNNLHCENFDCFNNTITFNGNNTNKNSTSSFCCGNTVKLDEFTLKNINTLTNMNSTNNLTSCKSSLIVDSENIKSFCDLAKSYFENINCNTNKNNDIYPNNDINIGIMSQIVNNLSPTSKFYIIYPIIFIYLYLIYFYLII